MGFQFLCFFAVTEIIGMRMPIKPIKDRYHVSIFKLLNAKFRSNNSKPITPDIKIAW